MLDSDLMPIASLLDTKTKPSCKAKPRAKTGFEIAYLSAVLLIAIVLGSLLDGCSIVQEFKHCTRQAKTYLITRVRGTR